MGASQAPGSGYRGLSICLGTRPLIICHLHLWGEGRCPVVPRVFKNGWAKTGKRRETAGLIQVCGFFVFFRRFNSSQLFTV